MPINSDGRVKGMETYVSDRPRQLVVVIPTGSVATEACARRSDEVRSHSATVREIRFFGSITVAGGELSAERTRNDCCEQGRK